MEILHMIKVELNFEWPGTRVLGIGGYKKSISISANEAKICAKVNSALK